MKYSITVNTCQTGNPILKCIKNVAWEYGETLADYEVGKTAGLLYLSLRYHKLHPNYIYERLATLNRSTNSGYITRIVLIHIDTSAANLVRTSLREITRACESLNFTIVLSWSLEEAARYIECFKAFEKRPGEAIKPKTEKSVVQFYNTIPGINQSDSEMLARTFKNLAEFAETASDTLSLLPGLGPRKVTNIKDVLDTPL